MCQACDYNDVNDAVRFGYHLYLGPGRYMASMADEQTRSLSGYVKEVLGIWQQLRATLFDGELLDTLEVQVVASGEILHTTHRNPTTGKRAGERQHQPRATGRRGRGVVGRYAQGELRGPTPSLYLPWLRRSPGRTEMRPGIVSRRIAGHPGPLTLPVA